MKRRAALLLALFLLLTGCGTGRDENTQGPAEPLASGEAAVEPSQAAPSQPEPVRRATLLAVGDNLIHDVIYQQARGRTPGREYDFLPVYDRVKDAVAAADLAYINQETPMAEGGPATYPMFNTPPEMAEDLQALGFDVVNIANNHMLDQGSEGLRQTLLRLRERDYAVIGAYLDQTEHQPVPTLERGGITFAFVGFTQHTNGLRLPAGREDMILYTDQEEPVRRQIAAAREAADVVVVSVHWGEEGTTRLTDYQEELARKFAAWGADLVIGTHPHVLQPIQVLEGADGHKTTVLYSLGNFVSAQIGPANLIGAMASIPVELDPQTGTVTVGRPCLEPVITQYEAGFRNLRLIPLAEYTDELAGQHGVVRQYGQRFDLAYIRGFLDEAVGSEYWSEGEALA